jgi:hypothetical protein
MTVVLAQNQFAIGSGANTEEVDAVRFVRDRSTARLLRRLHAKARDECVAQTQKQPDPGRGSPKAERARLSTPFVTSAASIGTAKASTRSAARNQLATPLSAGGGTSLTPRHGPDRAASASLWVLGIMNQT